MLKQSLISEGNILVRLRTLGFLLGENSSYLAENGLLDNVEAETIETIADVDDLVSEQLYEMSDVFSRYELVPIGSVDGDNITQIINE